MDSLYRFDVGVSGARREPPEHNQLSHFRYDENSDVSEIYGC